MTMTADSTKDLIRRSFVISVASVLAGTISMPLFLLLLACGFMLTTWPFLPPPPFAERPWLLASVAAGIVTALIAALVTLGIVVALRKLLNRHSARFALVVLVLLTALAAVTLHALAGLTIEAVPRVQNLGTGIWM